MWQLRKQGPRDRRLPALMATPMKQPSSMGRSNNRLERTAVQLRGPQQNRGVSQPAFRHASQPSTWRGTCSSSPSSPRSSLPTTFVGAGAMAAEPRHVVRLTPLIVDHDDSSDCRCQAHMGYYCHEWLSTVAVFLAWWRSTRLVLRMETQASRAPLRRAFR